MSFTIDMITKICKEVINNKNFDCLSDEVEYCCKKINCSSICPFENGIECLLMADNKEDKEHRKKIAKKFLNENGIKININDKESDKENKTEDAIDINCETCSKFNLIQNDCSSCVDFSHYEDNVSIKEQDLYKNKTNKKINEEINELKDGGNVNIKECIVSENKVNKKIENKNIKNNPSIGNLIFYKNQICSKNIGFIKQVHRVIESEIKEDINKNAYIVQPIDESKTFEIITEDDILKVYEEKRKDKK